MPIIATQQEVRATRPELITVTNAVIDKNQSFLGFLFFFWGDLSEIIQAPRAVANDSFLASDRAIAVALTTML